MSAEIVGRMNNCDQCGAIYAYEEGTTLCPNCRNKVRDETADCEKRIPVLCPECNQEAVPEIVQSVVQKIFVQTQLRCSNCKDRGNYFIKIQPGKIRGD